MFLNQEASFTFFTKVRLIYCFGMQNGSSHPRLRRRSTYNFLSARAIFGMLTNFTFNECFLPSAIWLRIHVQHLFLRANADQATAKATSVFGLCCHSINLCSPSKRFCFRSNSSRIDWLEKRREFVAFVFAFAWSVLTRTKKIKILQMNRVIKCVSIP